MPQRELTHPQAFSSLHAPSSSVSHPSTSHLFLILQVLPATSSGQLALPLPIKSGSLVTGFIVPCTVLQRTDPSSCSEQGTWHKAVRTRRHPRNICWINKCEFIILPNFTKKQPLKTKLSSWNAVTWKWQRPVETSSVCDYFLGSNVHRFSFILKLLSYPWSTHVWSWEVDGANHGREGIVRM